MAVGDTLAEKVADLYGNPMIIYPLSPEILAKCKWRYDFHIKKPKSIWVYVDSSNKVNSRTWKKHKDVTEEHGGRWRVVDTRTSKVVAEGGTA